MPLLTTAAEYVSEWGYLETGQLLTRIDVVDDTTVDTVTAMQTAMETAGELNSTVEAEINKVLNRAEADVRIHIETTYGFPPTKDGFATTTHPILKYTTLVLARYYLHDYLSERSDIPVPIVGLYDQYMSYLKEIKSGDIELEKLDETETPILYHL